MGKPTRNYLVDLIMLVLALFEAVSGSVLWPVLPRGGGYKTGSPYAKLEENEE